MRLGTLWEKLLHTYSWTFEEGHDCRLLLKSLTSVAELLLNAEGLVAGDSCLQLKQGDSSWKTGMNSLPVSFTSSFPLGCPTDRTSWNQLAVDSGK